MSTTMPPPPLRAPLTDQSGNVSIAWSDFFRQLFKRIGENVAPSNLELASTPGNITIVQTQVATLQAQVSALQTNINDLSQGQDI